MDESTLRKALEFLYFDEPEEPAQLSFFGGEPFAASELMKKAIEIAQSKAYIARRELVLQCTTNGTLIGEEQVEMIKACGMHVTVSIDGVREAHEMNRPKSGGQSSFDEAFRGLQRLLQGGANVDVLMVVTPKTAPFLFRSVAWFWDQGVARVRANLDLTTSWSPTDRSELQEELKAAAREQLARRMAGHQVSFEPFEPGLNDWAATRSGTCMGGESSPEVVEREQIVVSTRGTLYPCAPMVGEDRDQGREAALRLGHIDDGASVIAARVRQQGAGCDRGGACACAAYLETGDRYSGGKMGLWFGAACAELGKAVAAGLGTEPRQPTAGLVYPPRQEEPRPERRTRRQILQGMAVAASGIGLVGAGAYGLQRLFARRGDCDLPQVLFPARRDSNLKAPGQMEVPPPVVEGGLKPRPVAPKPVAPTETVAAGEIKRPPPPRAKGEVRPPPKDPKPPAVRGRMKPPPRPKKKEKDKQ
jgi:MoaA/NifB/PqqE/SkfB family radical SAM enzyme